MKLTQLITQYVPSGKAWARVLKAMSGNWGPSPVLWVKARTSAL